MPAPYNPCMAKHSAFKFAALTDTGLIRAHNEDAVAISTEYGYVILADGMGGYNAGEVASEMAITIVRQCLDAEMPAARPDQHGALLEQAIARANEAILDAADAPEYHGMGTTVVAAILGHRNITIAHVGDSRAYRLRQNEFMQITRDHSVLQQQIDAGLITPQAARTSPIRNLVTRAVGNEAPLEVEVHAYPTAPGDLYLFCSDGLSDMLEDAEIQDILQHSQTGLAAACEALIQQANAKGGSDNISVILCEVVAEAPERGLLNRILQWVNKE